METGIETEMATTNLRSTRKSVVPATAPPEVATATRWQISGVVDTLHQSFLDDPFLAWVFPTAERRSSQVRALWERAIQRRPQFSRIWQASDTNAVALWHGPAQGRRIPDESFRPWFRALLGNDLLAHDRFRFFGLLSETRPVDTHWYVAAVGTQPRLQGTGLGTRLMAPMLTQCDAEGVPTYLESTNARNVPFYERLGFVVVEELQLPDGSGCVTRMERYSQ